MRTNGAARLPLRVERADLLMYKSKKAGKNRISGS